MKIGVFLGKFSSKYCFSDPFTRVDVIVIRESTFPFICKKVLKKVMLFGYCTEEKCQKVPFFHQKHTF